MQGHSQTGQKVWPLGILTLSSVYLHYFVCLKSFLSLQINALITGTSLKETSPRRKIKTMFFLSTKYLPKCTQDQQRVGRRLLDKLCEKTGSSPRASINLYHNSQGVRLGWYQPVLCLVSSVTCSHEAAHRWIRDKTQISLKDHSKGKTEINTLSMIFASAFARVLNEFYN